MIIQSLKKQTHTIFLRDLYSSSKLTTVTKKPELLLSTKRGNRVVNLLCCLQWVQINSEGDFCTNFIHSHNDSGLRWENHQNSYSFKLLNQISLFFTFI